LIIKAVREIDLNQIIEKVEREEVERKLREKGFPMHPLRKILDETNAYLLGRSLDVFHLYVCNRWKIDKAIRDRDMDYLDRIGLSPQELLNLIVYNKIRSNPKYLKDRCPDRFRDVLLNEKSD